jgi:hypothetical protein
MIQVPVGTNTSNIKLLASLQRPWTWTERTTGISVDSKEGERKNQRRVLIPHHRIDFSFESRIESTKVHFRARTERFLGKRESTARRRFQDILKSKLRYYPDHNSNPHDYTTTTSQQVPYHLLFISHSGNKKSNIIIWSDLV